MTPAVVVIAYNRPKVLRRLLGSLVAAEYPHGVEVPLVISIDRGAAGLSAPVVELAQRFEWPFGPQRGDRAAATPGAGAALSRVWTPGSALQWRRAA